MSACQRALALSACLINAPVIGRIASVITAVTPPAAFDPLDRGGEVSRLVAVAMAVAAEGDSGAGGSAGDGGGDALVPPTALPGPEQRPFAVTRRGRGSLALRGRFPAADTPRGGGDGRRWERRLLPGSSRGRGRPGAEVAAAEAAPPGRRLRREQRSPPGAAVTAQPRSLRRAEPGPAWAKRGRRSPERWAAE